MEMFYFPLKDYFSSDINKYCCVTAHNSAYMLHSRWSLRDSPHFHLRYLCGEKVIYAQTLYAIQKIFFELTLLRFAQQLLISANVVSNAKTIVQK